MFWPHIGDPLAGFQSALEAFPIGKYITQMTFAGVCVVALLGCRRELEPIDLAKLPFDFGEFESAGFILEPRSIFPETDGYRIRKDSVTIRYLGFTFVGREFFTLVDGRQDVNAFRVKIDRRVGAKILRSSLYGKFLLKDGRILIINRDLNMQIIVDKDSTELHFSTLTD